MPRRHFRRQARHLDDHRRPVGDRRRVPARDHTDRALNDVKDAIAKIRSDLPRTIDEPIVQRIEVESQSIVTYAASSPGMTPEQLSWFVDDVIRQLQGLKGVGRVERMGGVDREIQVRLDPDRLLAPGVTAATSTTSCARRMSICPAVAATSAARNRRSARSPAADASPSCRHADPLPGGREVRLVGSRRVVDDGRSSAPLRGSMASRSSPSRSTGPRARATYRRRRRQRQARRTRQKYPDVASPDRRQRHLHLWQLRIRHGDAGRGRPLAVIVVLFFLRDWRATLVAAIALPLSAIPTFWAMALMGFSLNLVSLLGITLVTGILVDDAIVEIENIVRHMRMGKPPYEPPWRRPTRSASRSSPSRSRSSRSSRRCRSWAALPASISSSSA